MHFRKFRTLIALAAALALASCADAADNAEEAADSAEVTVDAPVEDAMDSAEESADATDEAVADATGEVADAATDSETGGETEDAKPADDGPTVYASVQSTNDPLDQVIWCRDVRKRVTAKLCQDYRDQIADLDQGVAAFDPPRNMVKGKTREVRLAIGPEKEKSRIESLAGDEGKAATAGIEIGAKMRARLTGRAFDIDPAIPVDLEMGRSRRQVWTWDVTPQREGTHPLSAEITVLATDGTILNRYPSDLIKVNVTVSQNEAEEIARAKRAKQREEAEEQVSFWTRMARLLLQFWWAVVALLGGIVGGYFYLRNKIGNEDATPPPS